MMINQLPTDVPEGVDLETVERDYWVQMFEALDRLEKNDDFKKVILEGYFKDKAVNGVSMLANDNVVRGGYRSQLMEILVAISQLQDYFLTIKSLGDPRSIDDDEENEEG